MHSASQAVQLLVMLLYSPLFVGKDSYKAFICNNNELEHDIMLSVWCDVWKLVYTNELCGLGDATSCNVGGETCGVSLAVSYDACLDVACDACVVLGTVHLSYWPPALGPPSLQNDVLCFCTPFSFVGQCGSRCGPWHESRRACTCSLGFCNHRKQIRAY